MKKIKFGIVVFPGSNCDHDAYYVSKKILGADAEFLWHKETDLSSSDVIILPGGFSYGDYLRTGAIARFSPIMDRVIDFALNGGFVIGICNGFQILLEAGLLPGVLLQNRSLKFISKNVFLKIENNNTPFTKLYEQEIINIPIAHGDGNYYIEDHGLQELVKNNQIVFRYSSEDGVISESSNPNGSTYNIAGITNKKQNILGMMPHPERASDKALLKEDGFLLFRSITESLIK